MSEKEILNLSSIQPAKKRSKMTRAKAPDNIAPAPGTRKLRKRVGRGRSSGMGKTSSRGQKGQKSRSGYSRKAGFEGGQTPLYRRLPKRGFTNRNRIEFQQVNLWRLEKAGLSGDITPEILETRGLVPHARNLIKVLGTGEIKKAIRITADAFSESAKQKIEAAGGAITLRAQQNA